MTEYQVRGQEPKEEVQIYTWADATLRELTDLVKEVRHAIPLTPDPGPSSD